MQDPNTVNLGDLIFKLDQDRAWLLENLDKGKWPEIRNELASLERKISKLIISVQENNVDI
jgi:multidrug resistance efflux pump